MIEHILAGIGTLTLLAALLLFGLVAWIKFSGWRKGVRYGNVADGW